MMPSTECGRVVRSDMMKITKDFFSFLTVRGDRPTHKHTGEMPEARSHFAVIY